MADIKPSSTTPTKDAALQRLREQERRDLQKKGLLSPQPQAQPQAQPQGGAATPLQKKAEQQKVANKLKQNTDFQNITASAAIAAGNDTAAAITAGNDTAAAITAGNDTAAAAAANMTGSEAAPMNMTSPPDTVIPTKVALDVSENPALPNQSPSDDKVSDEIEESTPSFTPPTPKPNES